jgi:hypothetical protein
MKTTNTNTTRIGDRIPYTTTLMFGKGTIKESGIVIAIRETGEYKKILLDTGKEIYRAN